MAMGGEVEIALEQQEWSNKRQRLKVVVKVGERGKVTAEITRGPGERLSLLWGDVDIAMMLLLVEIEIYMG